MRRRYELLGGASVRWAGADLPYAIVEEVLGGCGLTSVVPKCGPHDAVRIGGIADVGGARPERLCPHFFIGATVVAHDASRRKIAGQIFYVGQRSFLQIQHGDVRPVLGNAVTQFPH